MRRRRILSAAVAFVVIACSDAPSAAPNGTAGPPSSGGVGQLSAPPGTDPGGNGGLQEPLPPTSAELIAADVDAGRIDEATGLLYRIFATFGDQRLPAAYVTADVREDNSALMRAVAEIDTLPAEIAAQIRPYLLRPTDPASPFNAARTASAGARTISYRPPSAGSITTAATCDQNLRWAYADGSNWLRVWAPCGSPDEASIPAVVAAADATYAAESTYFDGRRPLEDDGGQHQGWETRIDIYIVSSCAPRSAGNGAVGPTSAPVCLVGADGYAPASSRFEGDPAAFKSSGFLLINRNLLGNATRLRATVAHELMHLFEFSYNHGGFIGGHGEEWITEATATWAEWRFANAVPTSNAGPVFRAFQGSKVSLQADGTNNGYLSFGWPLFVEQQGAGNVRAIWKAIEGKKAGQIMPAIDGVLPFEANFRIFGMRGWNKELPINAPVTPWLDAPPVSAGGQRSRPFNERSPASIELVGTDKGATPTSLPGDSPSLWAHYQHFTVKDDVGQVVLDFTGVTPGERLDVDALVKIKGRSQWERKELPDGKTTWCIDNPDEAVEEFVVVLSNHAQTLAETLQGKWTVDSPKEPCLSYHIVIKWTEIYDGVPDPFRFEGYADTINPDAQGGQVMLIGSGTYSGSRSGYIGCNPGFQGILPEHGAGTATFQAIIVGDLVTINAFADFDSEFAGVSTWPIEGPRKGTFDASMGAQTPVETSGVEGGDLCPRSWTISATWEIKMKPPP